MPPPAKPLPLSEPVFRAEFDRQRHSAARAGRSLAVVHLSDPTRLSGSWERIVPSLLRTSDRVGFWGPGQCQILLPGADRTAAQITLARLERGLGRPVNGEIEVIEPPREPAAARGPAGARSVTSDPGLRLGPPADVRIEPTGVLALMSRPLPRWKRAADVLLAGGGLVVLAPLMVLIALAVKASSPGPVLFTQTRTGLNLKPFRILKFRTMRGNTDADRVKLQHINEMSGPLFKADDDPRVTRFGKILRTTSLDELPQLVNVLRGEMTLLGPRALSPPPHDYEQWQLRRFTVTPGVACTWQAQRRGDTDFNAWMRSDLDFVDQPDSPSRNLSLLLRTLRTVLNRSGGR